MMKPSVQFCEQKKLAFHRSKEAILHEASVNDVGSTLSVHPQVTHINCYKTIAYSFDKRADFSGIGERVRNNSTKEFYRRSMNRINGIDSEDEPFGLTTETLIF